MSDILLPDGNILHDADTPKIDGERRRLTFGDAPEVANPVKGTAADPGGDAATDAAAWALSNGYTVRDTGGEDVHGRKLATIAPVNGGPDLQNDLIAAGAMDPSHWKSIDDGGRSMDALTAPGARGLTGIEDPSPMAKDPNFQFLAEKARNERLADLQRRIDTGLLGQATNNMSGRDPRDDKNYGTFGPAFERGVDNMQSTFYGFADALGSAAGIDVLSEWGQDGVAANVVEAMRNPARVESWEDIDGFADAMTYALEAVGEFAPQLLTDIAAGAATGGTAVLGKEALAMGGKALLRRAGTQAVAAPRRVGAAGWEAFAPAAKGGAFTSAYMQNAGETQNQFQAEGIDAPGQALAIGVGKAALDYAGLDATLRQAFKGLGKEAAGDPFKLTQWLGRSAAAASVAFSAESVTEGAQTLMDELAIQGHKPDYEVNWSGVVDAMLKGGIGGGVAGGGGYAATSMLNSGSQPAIPGAQDPLQDTAPEPFGDIIAQVKSTPQGEGNWYTSQNAEQAKQAAAEAGKSFRELADGSVAVGTDEVLAQLSDQPTQADIARLNGYAQTKDEALADPQGAVVVETRDANGAVLRNQIVGAQIADAIRAQQESKFPGAQTAITSAEKAVASRQQAVDLESRLDSKDPSAALAEADALGIDLSQFQADKLGPAMVERLTVGLKAKLDPSQVRKGGNNRRLNDVSALAEVLDLPAEQLKVEYHNDSRNIIRARDQLLQLVESRAQEKFGSVEGLAKAVNELPRRKAEAIRAALGLGDDAVGGFDMPGLLSAIRARKPSDTQTPSPRDEPAVTERQGAAPRPDQGARLHDLVMGEPVLRNLVTNGDGSRARTGEIAERLRTLGKGDRVRLEQMFKQLDLGEGGSRRSDFLELLGEVAVGPVTHDIGSRFVDDTEAGDESGARIVEPTTEFQPSILDSRAARLLGELRTTPVDKKGPNGEPVGLIKHLEALGHIVGTVQEEQGKESALSDRESAQLRRVALAAQTVSLLNRLLPDAFPSARLAEIQRAVALDIGVSQELLDKAAGRPVAMAEAVNSLGEVQDRRMAKALLTMVAYLEYPEALSDAVALKLLLSAAERKPEAVASIIAHRFKAFGDGTLADVGGLLALYARVSGEERGASAGERSLTADAGSKDQGAMNLVAVDHELENENEQDASDKAFFGYVTRSALRAWDAAVLPTAEQLPKVKFLSGESQARTEALGGKNLLALPTYSGSLFGRVVDAVALSHYAQAGEHAPQSAGDALGYFLSNLGRLVTGGQSSHDPRAGAPRAFLRTIPDELVIFVKDNGEAVTLGEALAEQRRTAKGTAALVEAQRRLDTLTDEIDARAEALSGAVEQLDALAENPAATDVVREAVSHWKAVLAGEARSVDGRPVYERAPHRSIGDGSRYFGAYEKIGNILQVDGQPLHAAHKELLAKLGERKRLAAEAKRLRAERDQQGRQQPVESAAKRESFSEAQEGVEAEDRSYPRALDNEQAEFDPYLDAHDPLGGLTAANRLEALAALAREGRLSAKPGVAPANAAPKPARTKAKAAPDRITDTRFRDLVNQLRKQGVPLPPMVLLVDGKQSIADQIDKTPMPPAEAQGMRDAALSGDSFYFLGADGTAYIGIADKGSRDRQMLDLTHELGHAVKDEVWGDLLDDHRAELAAGFRADLGFDPQNDDQMHEWFADQFSRAVLEHRDAVVRQDAGLIDRALQALLNRLTRLWETLMGTPAGMNPAFRAFATSLFSGQYAQTANVAIAEGVVRNASGLEREQRRMTKLPSKAGPLWQSADGKAMIRARHKIEAGDREFENDEAVLPMGHAAWLEEGNSFWRVDLFAKGEFGVLQKVGHGVFQLSDSDGSIRAIHDIKVYTKRQGHGEQVVASILASGQPLRIIEAISEAQPFWDRMGALGGYDHYNNTWLTWGDYVRAKQSGRADQRRAAEQSGDLGSPLRGNGSDTADAGREGRPGDGDGRGQTEAGGVGGQAPLDAESLAFLEAFLGSEPKVRNASGIDQLRALRGRNQVLKTQAKAFWAKGVGAAKHLAPVFSMAYSRISRIDAGLARALFQPANERQSGLGQSWEQRSRALKGRLLAQVDRQLSEFHKEFAGDRSQREAQIQAAFVDAYTGKPQTAAGRKVQALTNQIAAEAAKDGLRSVDVSSLLAVSALGKGHAGPAVFDRRAVASRVSEFQKLVADALKVDDAEAHEIVGRIVDGPGHLEGAIAPGSPVGMHRTNRDLVEALGYDALRDGGWLLERHAEALFHWVDGLSKRASWEAIFGGRDNPAAEFNPNHRFIQKLEAIRSSKGEGAAREVLALVNGALGRHPAGESMPNWWRNTQGFITGWVGMTVLAFSGVASIPELALPLVRAGGRVGFRESFQDLGEARRFARDMGIVLSDASEQVMWQATGDQYRSPLISKMQSWFFRLNGNEWIVKTSRTLATGIGIRYLLQAAASQDNAALARLNIDAKTVLAWDAAGRPTWSPEQGADVQALAAAVTGAVNQFVNEATLNPSRFQATHWGNNPYMKMIWHLKHFLYTYGDTVLLGMYREMRRRWGHLDARQFQNAVSIAAPALIFAVAVMPLAMASLELRDWMRRLNGQSGKEYEGTLEYFQAVFDRAGGLGPIDFVLNLREQQEQGRSIWGTISPTMGKVDQLLGGGSSESKIRAMTPVWSQNKTLFGLLE